MRSIPEVVSLGAIINADDARLAAIAEAARNVDDWNALAQRAETEGVAPILYRHLSRADTSPRNGAVQTLRALSVRHRHATEIRVGEFARLSAALTEAGIESAALKGVALACLIYPRPGLRPMRDIDFLVRPSQARLAREVLEDHGYRFEAEQPSRYMRLHHHLPNGQRTVDGLVVSVEIHTSANSGDAPGRTTIDNLAAPLQTVRTPAGAFATLGHSDMLNQLCRHALEPGTTIRLVSAMDIQGYCERFDADIDWEDLARRYPYIPNFLRLLDLVVPLPPALSRYRYRGEPVEHPGRLVPTMTSALGRGRRFRGFIELLNPPRWWFRSYYGVGDGGRGEYRARLRHVSRVSVWTGRRMLSALGGTGRGGENRKRIG